MPNSNNTVTMEKRKSPRTILSSPINLPPSINGHLINISESGICFWVNEPIRFSKLLIAIQINKEFIQTEINIVWNKDMPAKKKFIYGASFTNLEKEDLQKIKEASTAKHKYYHR